MKLRTILFISITFPLILSFPGADKSIVKQSGPDTRQIPLAGKVVFKDTDRPVTEYGIWIEQWNGVNAWKSVIRGERIINEEGKFSFTFKQEGKFKIRILPSYCHYGLTVDDLAVTDEYGLTDIRLEVAGLTLTGSVVDDVSGHPVTGAILIPLDPKEIYENSQNLLNILEKIAAGNSHPGIHAKSDIKGRFEISPALGKLSLWANILVFHPDYTLWVGNAYGKVQIPKEMEVRLQKGNRVTGIVRNHAGNPYPEVLVTLFQQRMIHVCQEYCEAIPEPRLRWLPALSVLTDRDGKYATPPALQGSAELLANPSRTDPDQIPERKALEINGHEIHLDFSLGSDRVTWYGKAYYDDNHPASGVLLTAEQNSTSAPYPSFFKKALTDTQGRFEFDYVKPGLLEVGQCMPDGKEWVFVKEVILENPGRVEQDLQLKGSIIEGRVVDAYTNAPLGGKDFVVRASHGTLEDSRTFESAVSKDGQFVLEGLPPHIYNLEVMGPHPSQSPPLSLDLSNGQSIRTLLLKIVQRSALDMKLVGLSFDEWMKTKVKVRLAPHHGMVAIIQSWDDRQKSEQLLDRTAPSSDGSKGFFKNLNAGYWTLEITTEGVGTWKDNILLRPGESEKLTVHREDLR